MTEFQIDLLNPSGVRIGDGPLTTVTALADTRSLDLIGAASFTMPAQDERSAYITAGTLFDIYDRVDGYLGRFYYKTKMLQANATGKAQLRIECRDQLEELKRANVYFKRAYVNQDVAAVVDSLVALAGWTSVCESGIGDTSVTYEGDSVLLALDVLRDRWNQHYRLGAASVLEFGTFGDNNGIVLANMRGQVQTAIQSNRDIAIVDNIQLVEESDEIYNRIVALGAGQGVSQITLGDATLGEYEVEVGLNADGSLFYYIEDEDSIAAYGRRTKILVFPTIRPITNSDANTVNAANALKLAAEAYLAQHLRPRVTYAVSVRALRKPVNVGDVVRLQYRGVVEGYAWIDVDEEFYVMDVTRQRDVSGTRTAVLTISTLAERRTSDTDVVIEVINDLRALKLSVPITLAYSPVGPYTARIDLDHTAEFTVRIGAEVLFLNYAKVRFRTGHLKSSVTAVAAAPSEAGSGGPSSATSSGASSSSTTDNGGAMTSAGGSAHSHALAITSTGLGSSGSSNNETSGNPSTDHAHNITVTNTSGGTALNVVSAGGGAVTARANGVGGNLNTEVNDADHTHEMPHTHGIDHSHTGSTADSESTHTHTIGNHQHNMPHDHNIEHTHTVEVPEHSHNLAYGIFEDTALPQEISIIIDGVDRTIALSEGVGPWAPGGDPDPVEVELDITEYLVNAVGGLRQNHRIEFQADVGRGEIEFECDMLCSIQPIQVV